MRLSFLLAAAMATVYCATCNATVDSDQNKVSMVQSRLNGQADGTRFLRTHHENEQESDREERDLTDVFETKKAAVKKLAKEVMADNRRAKDVFQLWKEKGYTLDELNTFLKSAKYQHVYNQYMIFRGYV
ncbi:hypothetical protein DVH05_001143 [Phytophthora capsici]|nr:hypothetical protein DVH05_001141 [Phytophthora capsici]KAG1713356.1 hypothetical protein DVH05_001143 [Phytophthora capsici]